MTANELPPMTPGGQWLRSSADREPQYVVGEAHLKRLLSEGWQVADDPRTPVEVVEIEESAADTNGTEQSSNELVKDTDTRKARK